MVGVTGVMGVVGVAVVRLVVEPVDVGGVAPSVCLDDI